MALLHFNRVFFDDWIRKDFASDLLEKTPGIGFCHVRKLQVKNLPLPHPCELVIAHVLKGFMNRLSLRIMDRLLQTNENFRFHISSISLISSCKETCRHVFVLFFSSARVAETYAICG